MSPKVSSPPHPTDSHCASVSGSVAIIDEFIGNQVRRCPLRLAVNPSVHRST